MIKFLSIDSSMRNTGISWGTINGNEIHVDGIALFETKKSKNKQVRASSDTIRSCRETHDWLRDRIYEISPNIIFVETPSGSQNASGMKSYGATCQLIGTITPPPVEVTPDEAKIASVGNKKASKKEIMEWAYKSYPYLPWINGRDGYGNKNEHCADSIAVVHAGIKTKEYNQILPHIK